jgi:hypothetical protein
LSANRSEASKSIDLAAVPLVPDLVGLRPLAGTPSGG